MAQGVDKILSLLLEEEVSDIHFKVGSPPIVRRSGSIEHAEGYGELNWKSWLNFYRNTFYDIVEMPASVTVTSTGGGSDSQSLP